MKPYVISISGGSGSGKSLIAQVLAKRFKKHIVFLEADQYYKNAKHIPRISGKYLNFDNPKAFDHALLAKHILQLKKNKIIQSPIYNFLIHKRLKKTITKEPKPIILVEGILLLADPSLRKLIDLKTYIHAFSDRRVAYRLYRDLTERKFTIREAVYRYLHTASPMHYKYVKPTKKYANLILDSNVDIHIPIEQLAKIIHKILIKQKTHNEKYKSVDKKHYPKRFLKDIAKYTGG